MNRASFLSPLRMTAGMTLLTAAGLFAWSVLAPRLASPRTLAVKIEAPASLAAGELAVLSVAGEAPLLAWQAVPPTAHFLPIDGGRRAVFASPRAGTWTFVVAASTGSELVQTSHELTVAGPDPTPVPPTPTPNPSPVSLATLVRAWRAKVTSLTATAEAERLALSFESVAAQIAAGAIKTPEAIIQATATANQVALGAAREAWRPFFESLRVELNQREQRGPLDYATLWREIAGGLRT